MTTDETKTLCTLPDKGKASSYSDYFVAKRTASGDRYDHKAFTAAIMPRERWYCVKLGTRVCLTYRGKSVVVKINDRGAGNGKMERVLDLSRAAMSVLIGKELMTDTDALQAGVIDLDKIEIVPNNTPLGISIVPEK